MSEKSAITLQAFQILADNALLLARLDLVTGEYRIVKRDERLMGVPEEKTLQLESYCEQLVAEKAIHPEDAAQFRAQAKLELLQAALFRERRSVIRRFRPNGGGGVCLGARRGAALQRLQPGRPLGCGGRAGRISRGITVLSRPSAVVQGAFRAVWRQNLKQRLRFPKKNPMEKPGRC